MVGRCPSRSKVGCSRHAARDARQSGFMRSGTISNESKDSAWPQFLLKCGSIITVGWLRWISIMMTFFMRRVRPGLSWALVHAGGSSIPPSRRTQRQNSRADVVRHFKSTLWYEVFLSREIAVSLELPLDLKDGRGVQRFGKDPCPWSGRTPKL